MAKHTPEDMARLVISTFPEAAASLKIAETLVEYLPLESAEHLVKILEELPVEVMGVKISGEILIGILPEEIFPIERPETLASSVSAAVRGGARVIMQPDVMVENQELRDLAGKLTPRSEGQGPVAMGWFGNDSLFGFKHSEKGKEN